jgi:hypothetical protein
VARILVVRHEALQIPEAAVLAIASVAAVAGAVLVAVVALPFRPCTLSYYQSIGKKKKTIFGSNHRSCSQ